MERIGVLFIVFLTVSCHQVAKTDRTLPRGNELGNSNEIEIDPDWLIGNWKRLNNRAESRTFENWEKVSSTEYTGFSYTIKKGDTISREDMTLMQSHGIWTLRVKTPDEKEPVIFNMQELSDQQFVVTNDSIDFPKKIHYWMSKDTLNAKISNDKMQITFEFEKIK